MNKRGVSPILASVLIVLVAISLSGAFLVFTQSTTNQLTESSQESQEQLQAELDANPSIESVSGDTLFIRNRGGGELSAGDLTIFLNDRRVDFTLSSPIQPDSVGEATLNEDFTLKSGGDSSLRIASGLTDTVSVEVIGDTCKSILDWGASVGDGFYNIDPDGAGGGDPLRVTCNMTFDGGGWTKLWVFPDNREYGWYFTDRITDEPDNWGHGDIPDRFGTSPPYYMDSGSGTTTVYQLDFYDEGGTQFSFNQVTALKSAVSTTAYDGWYYHSDMDSPCGCEGVGPYGCPDDTTHNDGGGGYVIFPSRSGVPSTGSDFVICDADNPHASNGGGSDRENLQWETIANGLVTHMGVQDRSDAETSDVTWGIKDGGGAARGILENPYIWVR